MRVTPAPQLVDRAIQACPIDTRRSLYGNIVLSVRPLPGLGMLTGSLLFRDPASCCHVALAC
jgi:hypothetical protein